MSSTAPQPNSASTVPLPAAQLPQGQPLPAAPAPGRLTTATTVGATNAYALIAIILAFIVPIAAIVFGHLALGQIKRNGDAGRGLALTGTILGYAYCGLLALFFLVYIIMFFVLFGAMGTAFTAFDSSAYSDYSYGYGS